MPPSNVYQNPSIQPPVVNQAVTQGNMQNPASINASKKKKIPKILLFIGIAFLFIVLILAAVKFFINPGTKSTGNITWWGLWEDGSVIQPLISSYESSHPGIEITYIAQSKEDYRERLANSLAKGEGPDIFTFHNTWVPMFKSDLDALPSSVMTAADYSKNFYRVITSDMSYGNSIVGIPVGYDALTLFINQELFDKAGVSPPTTWDNFQADSCKLTIKDDRGVITQAGAAMGSTENVDHWPEIVALLMIQNKANPANPADSLAKGAITFFVSFANSAACKGLGSVWDNSLPSSTQAFAGGKLAMYIAPSWRTFEIQALNPNLKFKTVPIPQLPKDSPDQLDITYATYWSQGVWSKSPNKSIAWDFLNYVTSDDSLQVLYKNESAIRSFGEPYPKVDLASLLKDHPIVGSIISQAPGARSWYLASQTHDGDTGINTLISNYYKDAINTISTGKKSVDEALATATQGVAQVLSQYGLTAK